MVDFSSRIVLQGEVERIQLTACCLVLEPCLSGVDVPRLVSRMVYDRATRSQFAVCCYTRSVFSVTNEDQVCYGSIHYGHEVYPFIFLP